jgi:hypothetical protein
MFPITTDLKADIDLHRAIEYHQSKQNETASRWFSYLEEALSGPTCEIADTRTRYVATESQSLMRPLENEMLNSIKHTTT